MLEAAVRVEAARSYVYDLGRALLAVGRAADAVAAQRRALQLAGAQGGGEAELERSTTSSASRSSVKALRRRRKRSSARPGAWPSAGPTRRGA